jgi:hypothetical protein
VGTCVAQGTSSRNSNSDVSGHAWAVSSVSVWGSPTHGNLPAGAPPHWGRILRDYLDATFPNHLLGRDGPLAWPPRPPDSRPLDFFLWGYVKDKVYANKVTGVADLKTRIRDVVTTIMLARTWEKLEFLLDVLRATQGAQIEVCWVNKKNFIKLISHYSWQFLIEL